MISESFTRNFMCRNELWCRESGQRRRFNQSEMQKLLKSMAIGSDKMLVFYACSMNTSKVRCHALTHIECLVKVLSPWDMSKTNTHAQYQYAKQFS